MVPTRDKTDRAMMARCIELSRLAVGEGEYPFGTVIALDGQVIAEATNRTVRDADVSRHAEVIALSLARRTLGLDQLRRSTLYSNIEPCAMCSYCIREAWVGRVVYAIGSPVMGGLSKWDILRDHGLSERMPQVFGAVPEVVGGVLFDEAQRAWREWNPVAWELIKLRGLLTEPRPEGSRIKVLPAGDLSPWQYLRLLFARGGQPRTG
jgi:tRNA(adenine34) deaminase